jgi:hypothetical protein
MESITFSLVKMDLGLVFFRTKIEWPAANISLVNGGFSATFDNCSSIDHLCKAEHLCLRKVWVMPYCSASY